MATDYASEIQKQLDRLSDAEPKLKSGKALRERTIRALAEGEVIGLSRNQVLGRKDTVSPRTFYSKNKDWLHHPVFKDVLDRVTALYIQRDGEQREAAAEAEAINRHYERAQLIRKAKARSSELLDDMETAGHSPSSIASLLKVVLEQERVEFGESGPPTELDVNLGWREQLPPGGSIADAEQAIKILADAMAAEPDEESLIDQGDLDD